MSYDEIIEHTSAFVTEAVFTLASPVGIPGADQATAAVQLSKNLGAFVKIQHNATNAIVKGAGVIKKAVPTVAEAIVEGVGIVGGLAKEGKELAGRTLNIVARNPKIAKAEGGVADAVKKVASIEKKIEEKNIIFKLWEKATPGPGGSTEFQRKVNLVEDGIQILFRNDTGTRAHKLGKHFPKGKKISHYNVEIKEMTGKTMQRRGEIIYETKPCYDYHIVVNKQGKVIKTFWS